MKIRRLLAFVAAVLLFTQSATAQQVKPTPTPTFKWPLRSATTNPFCRNPALYPTLASQLKCQQQFNTSPFLKSNCYNSDKYKTQTEKWNCLKSKQFGSSSLTGLPNRWVRPLATPSPVATTFEGRACNQTDQTLTFTWTSINGDQAKTKGWWVASPGECKSFTLSKSNRHYFTSYMSYYTDIYWTEGDAKVCISKAREAFDYSYSMTGQCPYGSMARPAFEVTASEPDRNFIYTGPDPAKRKQQSSNYSSGSRNYNSNNNNSDGWLLALGAIAVLGIAAAGANERREEEECMRECRKSKARCVTLCTQ